MRDKLDVSLEDEDLLDEVELTTSLIIAASECPHDYMSQEEIDAVLGLPPARNDTSSSGDVTRQAKVPRPRVPAPDQERSSAASP